MAKSRISRNVTSKVGIPGLVTSTIGSEWESIEQRISVLPLSGETVTPQPGEPNTFSRPVIGELGGYSSREIKKMGLTVEVRIKTDEWYTQGSVEVQPDGHWVLEDARFGGITHLVEATIRDKNGKKITSTDFIVVAQR